MTLRASLIMVTTTLAAAGGCTTADRDPETTVAARDEIRLPAVVPYKPGNVDPDSLVPDGLSYIHLAYTPGDDERSSYVWGIADGRVLYIYRVGSEEDDDDLRNQFIIKIREREAANAHIGHGIAGTTGSGVPRPPTPPGEPEFSQDYAAAVLTAAGITQTATEEMVWTLTDY
jgi:hypothetical protein